MWCKKSPPTREFISSYVFQKPVVKEEVKPGRVPRDQLEPILKTADDIGKLIQNSHPGNFYKLIKIYNE